MARGADLFVVCKNCGSEVSPYVTECPYCGQRVRKRAPKLDRGASAPEQRARRRRPRLPRLRADEIEGIAPEARPWATMLVVALSLASTVVFAADERSNDLLGVYVIAAVLVLLSVAVEEANIAAAAGGAAAGALLAPALPLFTRRAAH